MYNINKLIQLSFLLVCIFQAKTGYAQTKILHYTETSGFDHQTRQVSYTMFNQMAGLLGAIVDDDSTGITFSSLASLQSYKVIIFSNTSGDAILDSVQKINFEQYIAGGGNVIGIHSATDTYRHSTSNGTNTGTWDFFPELLGASVRQNPSHVNGTPNFTMTAMQLHPLLTGIPTSWEKEEEYYYWEDGYFDPTNNILLQVEQTGPVSYDSSRATTWFRDNGINRIFYTSLGHLSSNFTLDTLFYKLINNALQWTASINLNMDSHNKMDIEIFPNPINNYFSVSGITNGVLDVFSIEGKKVFSVEIKNNHTLCNVEHLEHGCYIFNFYSDEYRFSKKILRVEK